MEEDEDKGEEDHDTLLVAVTVDEEEWLPQIVLGIPWDADVEGMATPTLIPLTMTPEEAFHVGQYLIMAAEAVGEYHAELSGKTIAERKEIMSLESQFVDDFSMPT